MDSLVDEFGSVIDGKRILIAGGLGFIGSRLAHRLTQLRARVSIIDIADPMSGANRHNLAGIKSQVKLTVGDLCDTSLVARLIKNQEIIFNLAGQVGHLASMKEPYLDHRKNSLAALHLIEACRMENPAVKIIYAGTRQVYGRPQYLPVDESHPVDPIDYNGVSKLAGEMYHQVSRKIYGLRTTILRMTNVYGPGMRVKDDRQTFIGWWFRQLIDGQELQVYGSGAQTRDLNFVDDIVDALISTALNPVSDGQIYNLGSGQSICLLDLARLMIRIHGSGGFRLTPFPAERKRIDIGTFYTDTTKIEKALGWRPKTSLEDGIALTLDFYRKNKEYYW